MCLLYQMLAGASAFVCCVLLCSASLIAAQIDPDIKLEVNTTSIRDGDVIKVLLSLLLAASQHEAACQVNNMHGTGHQSGSLGRCCLS